MDDTQNFDPASDATQPWYLLNPTKGWNGSFGSTPFDTIAGYFKTATGGRYTPSYQDVSQWGGNIDQGYMDKIHGAVGQWASGWLQNNPAQNTNTGAPTNPSGLPSLTGNVTDPNVLLQYIKNWSTQGQADPSLANDPNYWVKRITETGGLSSANLDYWQKAAYGPSAFYLNPGRESNNGTPGQVTPAPVQQPTPSANPQDDALRQQLIDSLIKRSTQSLSIDQNDPLIRQQADPLEAQMTRDAREALSGMAESGGPSANLEGEQRVMAERTGQAKGQLESSLIGNELTARRQEIQSALSGMQGLLTADQQMALEKELGYLDDATKRIGLSNSFALGTAGLNQDWMKALLSNQQFLDSLGLESEQQYNYWLPGNHPTY